MKKIIILATIVTLITVCSAFAEVIRAGGGSPTGVYTTVVLPSINNFFKSSGNNIDIIPGGTQINMERLKKGELDIAVIQFDGLTAEDTLINLDIIAYLHKEYVHFYVKDEKAGGKIDEFSDLGESHTVAIGDMKGGTSLTWKNFVRLKKSLAKIQLSPLSGVRALTALQSGQIDALLSVSGLRDKNAMRANSSPDQFELVEIDINALNNLEYKGKKVYEFDKINSSVYPGLIQGITNLSQQCLTVQAVLVCTPEWAEANEETFTKLYDATNQALPGILAATKNK